MTLVYLPHRPMSSRWPGRHFNVPDLEFEPERHHHGLRHPAYLPGEIAHPLDIASDLVTIV